MNELANAVNKLIQFNVDNITHAIQSDDHDQKLDKIIVIGESSWEFLDALLQSKKFVDHIDSELKRRIQLIVADTYYINTQRILRQEKYKYVQSIFNSRLDHSQFISLFHLLENTLTEKLPFYINKTISEFANGNVYFCSNSECNEQILLLISESGKKYDNYCAVFDKYWCRKCSKNLLYCWECSAIQWKPSAVVCMNDDCKNEGVYLCQNKQCSHYRHKAKGCSICDRIICGGYHEWNSELDLVDIIHCIQCKQLCCNQCSNICTICDEHICAFCISQYELECKSATCKSIVMNHPSCKKYCDCERNQSEYCDHCITHSCIQPGKVRIKCISGTRAQECGSNCKICLSEK